MGIIDVLQKYDITAIQEVQDVSLALPGELIDKLNEPDLNYNVVSSNRLGRGNRKEQYLFVYNEDRIDYVVNTSGYSTESNDEYTREPFFAQFRAGNFDFYLMTIHTKPDSVHKEVPALKDAYLELQSNTPEEDDIIFLGDFNAKPPYATVHSYIAMDSIATIHTIVFTINEATNTKGGELYDNIIFQSNYTSEYADSSGVYSFWLDYGLTQDEGFQISDHQLVWATFYLPNQDDD